MDYHAVLKKPKESHIIVTFNYGKKFIKGWDKSIFTRVNFSDQRDLPDIVDEFDSDFLPSILKQTDGERSIFILYPSYDRDEVISPFTRYFVKLSEKNRSGLRIEC